MRKRGADTVDFLIRLYRQSPVPQYVLKPGLPPAPPAGAQRELRMPPPAAIAPCRCIAKALATILPPAAGPSFDIFGAQGILAPPRAPSELAARPRRDLRADQVLVAQPHRVSQPQPDEVR